MGYYKNLLIRIEDKCHHDPVLFKKVVQDFLRWSRCEYGIPYTDELREVIKEMREDEISI